MGFEVCAGVDEGVDAVGALEGVSVTRSEDGEALGFEISRSLLAGGPTGTILEPNSTPMVTSWWGVKRPSQRRIVNYKDM